MESQPTWMQVTFWSFAITVQQLMSCYPTFIHSVWLNNKNIQHSVAPTPLLTVIYKRKDCRHFIIITTSQMNHQIWAWQDLMIPTRNKVSHHNIQPKAKHILKYSARLMCKLWFRKQFCFPGIRTSQLVQNNIKLSANNTLCNTYLGQKYSCKHTLRCLMNIFIH